MAQKTTPGISRGSGARSVDERDAALASCRRFWDRLDESSLAGQLTHQLKKCFITASEYEVRHRQAVYADHLDLEVSHTVAVRIAANDPSREGQFTGDPVEGL
jgi:hypothetical protein